KRVGEVGSAARKRQQKSGEAATYSDDRGNAGESLSREDLLDVGEQVGQVARRLERVQVDGTQGNQLVGSWRYHPKSARLIAVYFKEFDFQHNFSAGAFELRDEFIGKREPLRRVAHGDGAAARVDIDARSTGDVAEDKQQLGDILSVTIGSERICLLRLQTDMPTLTVH